jgi:guanylate kinase
MTHWNEFDFVVVNDDFALALDDLLGVVRGTGAERAAVGRPGLAELAAGLTAGGGDRG